MRLSEVLSGNQGWCLVDESVDALVDESIDASIDASVGYAVDGSVNCWVILVILLLGDLGVICGGVFFYD